ncbi:MAG: hypothetical protein QOG55_2921 [Acidobacteriaceae bacterium]|jgi:hypothetical protein|nr:hypothetical protein [Acidobacteriaceae bacterium]
MRTASAKPTPTHERCQYRTPTGRQCASRILGPGFSYCVRHSFAQPLPSQPRPLNHLTPRTLPLSSPRTPRTSRTPRASTTPSPPSTNSSPADKSPLAAPPDSPTSPACSSALFLTSATVTPTPSGPPACPLGAASDAQKTKNPHSRNPHHLETPQRPKKTTHRLACLGRASRRPTIVPNILQLACLGRRKHARLP